jgi:hypothetical protein
MRRLLEVRREGQGEGLVGGVTVWHSLTAWLGPSSQFALCNFLCLSRAMGRSKCNEMTVLGEYADRQK